jgi:hypothetical protein
MKKSVDYVSTEVEIVNVKVASLFAVVDPVTTTVPATELTGAAAVGEVNKGGKYGL